MQRRQTVRIRKLNSKRQFTLPAVAASGKKTAQTADTVSQSRSGCNGIRGFEKRQVFDFQGDEGCRHRTDEPPEKTRPPFQILKTSSGLALKTSKLIITYNSRPPIMPEIRITKTDRKYHRI